MKKLLAILLSAALIAPTAATALNADNSATGMNKSSQSAEVTLTGADFTSYNMSSSGDVKVGFTAKSGDMITVYVKIKNTENVSGLFGAVNFDKTALIYKGFSSDYADNYANNPSSGYILYNILFDESGTNLTSETTVAEFSFKARKDISSDDEVISFSVKEFYNSTLVELSSDGKISYNAVNTTDNSNDTDTSSDTSHTHTVVTDPAVAPTCTEAGLTEGAHCSVCGEVITAQQTVSAKGHTSVTDPAVAPTCTETGLTEGAHCSVCGEVITAQQTVSAKGHTSVTDPAVAPTCTEAGLTEGAHCFVCGEVITPQSTVPAKGHSYSDGKCSVCGKLDPDYNTDTDTDTDTDSDTPPAFKGIYGDLSGDENITAIDSYIVLRYVVSYHTFTENDKILADVNCDGIINTIDSLEILRYSVGFSTDLKIGQEVE